MLSSRDGMDVQVLRCRKRRVVVILMIELAGLHVQGCDANFCDFDQ